MLVNGRPAQRLAALRERDVVQLPGNLVLHVAIFHRPNLAPAEPPDAGRECLLCRLPVGNSRCYRCACGAYLHAEHGHPDALQCASLVRSGCLACGRAVVLTAGFAWLPEVADE